MPTSSPARNDITHDVLYDGYILYPYQPTSLKNWRERFAFGRVYPAAYSVAQEGVEPSLMQTECLVRVPRPNAKVQATVRFLHPAWREVTVPDANPHARFAKNGGQRVVPELCVGDLMYQTWQEAVEREIQLVPLVLKEGYVCSTNHRIEFKGSRTSEPIKDQAGQTVGAIVRRQDALDGWVEMEAAKVADEYWKISVRIFNHTFVPPNSLFSQDAIIMRTFASTHTIIEAEQCEFVSLTDPPPELEAVARSCRNIGTWPVLTGDAAAGDHSAMLSSPIILPDYPKVAPESGDESFDTPEIDEMLASRVTTLTDLEHQRIAGVDAVRRGLRERSHLSSHRFMTLPGTLPDVGTGADLLSSHKRVREISVNGITVRPGAKVRLCPKQRADLMLKGRTAVVEALEQDTENRIHIAVVLEDDPGRAVGPQWQTGPRFYDMDEVEPLKEAV